MMLSVTNSLYVFLLRFTTDIQCLFQAWRIGLEFTTFYFHGYKSISEQADNINTQHIFRINEKTPCVQYFIKDRPSAL